MQPSNNNGAIQIRFRKFSYSYSMSKLGRYDDTRSLRQAQSICDAIDNDIKLGRFTAKNNDELFEAYHPLAKVASHHEQNSKAVDCLALVDEKLSSKVFRDRNLHQTRNFLIRYGKPIKSKDDALKFWNWLQGESNGNSRTINRHLTSLKPICPYFADIPKLKESAIKSEKPFSKDEIKAIIQSFEGNFPHYTDFVKFLFSTGCRPNEATALRWQDVDFENKQIVICEALAIANDGSKAAKDTKTHVIRTIPMSRKVAMLLVSINGERIREKFLTGKDTDLVFPTVEGKFIDIRTFRARQWVKALQLAKVPYRKPYNCRHTFCSHFLNENPDFVQLASITHGTKSGIATLQKHYAHIVNKPVMPDMF